MLQNEETRTFTEADAAQKGTERRCIDGTTTGRNLCRGYCNYAGHRGFLTEPLMRSHSCEQKNCVYFAPKLKHNRMRLPAPQPAAELLRAAQELTAAMEGLRLMNCVYTGGRYRITYAAAAGYDLGPVGRALRETTGTEPEFKQLKCDFEAACKLVFC